MKSRCVSSASPMDAPATDALTLDQLRLFLAVLDAGSFSAAARSLRRAQSVVSYGIANLERQLAIPLFDRARRRPRLTPAGAELAAEARAVCAQVDRLKARARGVAQGVEPQLAVALDHMFPLPAMVRALGDFRGHFPTVALTLHTEALGAVAELVVQGACSVGIGALVPRMPDSIERWPLARVTMLHVVSSAHPLARLARSTRRGPVPASAVREHVQIVLADRSRLTADFEIGVFGGRTWKVHDLAAKHALLRAGLGWGGMPMHVVAEDLAKKRLVHLHIQEAEAPTFEAVLFAMHRTAEPPGPAARWLLDSLGEGCQKKR
jgi:DNA-binding transcriptional LysR family regulator